MRRLVAVVVLLTAVTLLTACDGGVPGPGKSDVAVDTPELREQKATAGIEDCEPGTGESGLPDLVLPCLGGGPDVDLSSLEGPLVINLWNTTCQPCLREMPVLQEFHETYGDQVSLIGLDVTDTQPGSAISFAERVGATYPQLADPGGEVFEQDAVRVVPAYPQFLLVDADGRVADPVTGGLDSLAEVVAMVEDTLGITL